MTLANDNIDKDPAYQIRQGALNEADGDLEKAFISLSIRTANLLQETNELQADYEVCSKALDRMERFYGVSDDRSFLAKAWDSDVTKVAIFIGGFWLGSKVTAEVLKDN